MPSVDIKEGESFDVALRRFKRSCESILNEAKTRRFYEPPTTERKRKRASGIKRWEKKRRRDNEAYSTNPNDRRKAALAKFKRPFQPRLNINALISESDARRDAT